MKIKVLAWFLFSFCGLLPQQRVTITVTSLNLEYKEVMRCNGTFAKDDFNYINKYWFFGRDAVGNYGLIRFEGHQEKTQLPIVTPITKKRKQGDEWTEVYANDSIQVTLVGHPNPKLLQNAFYYDVDFVMIYKGDTTVQKLIGHCKF